MTDKVRPSQAAGVRSVGDLLHSSPLQNAPMPPAAARPWGPEERRHQGDANKALFTEANKHQLGQKGHTRVQSLTHIRFEQRHDPLLLDSPLTPRTSCSTRQVRINLGAAGHTAHRSQRVTGSGRAVLRSGALHYSYITVRGVSLACGPSRCHWGNSPTHSTRHRHRSE